MLVLDLTLSVSRWRTGPLKFVAMNLSLGGLLGSMCLLATTTFFFLTDILVLRYFLKAIQWARKYGIRINLDFHALPGSQNGWNHSGKLGTVNLLNGPMGLANAQRSLEYIRILAEFISQPHIQQVVVMIGITNEPQGPVIGLENLQR